MHIIGSLLITAVIYGAVPMIVLAFAKHIEEKKYKKVCIISTIIVGLICNVTSSMMGEGMSFAPALIWGTVFYYIGRSIIKKRW